MKKWASVVVGCGVVGCSGAPAPEAPKPSPAPSSVVVAPVVTASASAAAAPAPPPLTLLRIGAEYQVDPAEPLPRGAVARCGTTRMRASAPSATAVSNAGSIYVVDQVDHRWVLRDVTRGADLAALPAGRNAVFSPDASVVVVESQSGRLAFFSVPKGDALGHVDIPLPSKPAKPAKPGVLLALFANSNYVSDVLFAPGGKTVVVTTGEGAVHLVDAATRKLTKTLQLPPTGRLAGVSRDAGRAVVEILKDKPGAFSGLLSSPALLGYSVLDLRTGATLRKETFKQPKPDKADPDAYTPAPHKDASFQISADGKTVLRLENHDLAAIDVATGKEEEIGSFGKPQTGGFGLGSTFGSGLSFGGSRQRFEVLDEKRAVVGEELIDPTSGAVLSRIGAGFAATSADGEHIATRRGSRFELSSGDPELRPGNDGPVTELAFLPDNYLVTIASQATFWNTARCTPGRFPSRPARFAATAARKNATFLVAGEPVLLTPVGPEKIPAGAGLRIAALTPEGDRLYMGTGGRWEKENRLVAMDVPAGEDSGRQQRTFPGAILSIAAAPDGATVAISVEPSEDAREPMLHLLAGDSLSTKVEVEVARAGAVAFAGADRLLHAPERNGISVRALPSLDEVVRLHHVHCCERTAVSPDGKLAAGSDDRGFVIWEVGSRKVVARVNKAHREDITSLSFSADGRHLATGSKDTTVLFWDVQKLGAPPPAEKVETRVTGAAKAKSFIEATPAEFEITAGGSLAALPGLTKAKPPPLKAVTKVVSGWNSHCAISEGKVRCWGSTAYGVLGVPEKLVKNRFAPAEVTAPTTVPVNDPVDLRMTTRQVCALERGGGLVCWGKLSHKDTTPGPHKVMDGVKSFDVAHNRACAVGTDGSVRCWGPEDHTPVTLGAKDAVAVALGGDHNCILIKDGTVQCTGANGYDQLGDDTGLDRKGMVTVQGVSGAAAISAGQYSTCALTSSGSVLCWGSLGWVPLARATRIAALDGATALRIVERASGGVCGLLGDRAGCVTLEVTGD